MKNIFLTLVIVCALTIGGISGTLADYSDTAISEDNVIEVGNLDLKVSKGSGGPWFNDPDVPSMIQAQGVWPSTAREFTFELHNASDFDNPGYTYLRLRDIECYEVLSEKHPDGRPEPEVVAEEGGWLANHEISAVGAWGQNGTLADFIEIYLEFDTNGDGLTEPVLGNPDWGQPGTVYLSDLWDEQDKEGGWIPVGTMNGSETRQGHAILHIGSWSEEDWNNRFDTSLDYFDDDQPFDEWLTNLFMSDGLSFSMDFALTQEAIADKYICPEIEAR